MKKKKPPQPKPPMSLILHPKKAPKIEKQKVLPSLPKAPKPPSTARPKTNSKRNPRRNPRINKIKNPPKNPNPPKISPPSIQQSSQNDDQYPSLPNSPLNPSNILSTYSNLLTERERFEIERYRDIYYIRKSPPDPKSYMMYDPEFFPFIQDDHIKYRYQQLEELGRGSFGSVMKCYDHRTKKIVAVKLVRDNPKLHQQVQIEREVVDSLMNRSDESSAHHIVKIFDNFIYRSFVVFVFEVLSSNLYDALKADRFKGLDIPKVKIVGRQIADSISFLHSLNVIHCDIKPENILWTNPRHNVVKLIDFGCCCYLNNTLYTYIQSRFYRAPEVMLGIDYGQEIDVWSYGCVICELITGRPIFGGEDEIEQMALFISVLGHPPDELLEIATRKDKFFDEDNNPILKPNKRGKIHQPLSRPLASVLHTDDEDLLNLIKGCLKWLPEERLTAAEVLQHPWMNQEAANRPQTVK